MCLSLCIVAFLQSVSRKPKSDNKHCLKSNPKFTFKLILLNNNNKQQQQQQKAKNMFAEAFN